MNDDAIARVGPLRLKKKYFKNMGVNSLKIAISPEHVTVN